MRISQEAYIDAMLREYDLTEETGKDTPAPLDEITEADQPKTNGERVKVKRYPVRNAIGKLWWLIICAPFGRTGLQRNCGETSCG